MILNLFKIYPLSVNVVSIHTSCFLSSILMEKKKHHKWKKTVGPYNKMVARKESSAASHQCHGCPQVRALDMGDTHRGHTSTAAHLFLTTGILQCHLRETDRALEGAVPLCSALCSFTLGTVCTTIREGHKSQLASSFIFLTIENRDVLTLDNWAGALKAT